METPRTPGSAAAAEALERTSRPEPSQDDTAPRATPDGQEDTRLRELEPRSVQRQFGASPDIAPEADLEEGAEEWVEQSPEMKKSFPDRDGDNA